MIKQSTRLIKILLLVILFYSSIMPLSIADEVAITQAENIQIFSNCAILVDSNSGQVLFESNADQVTYPASTTKLMTAILTLENCKIDDTVQVSADALNGIPPTYTTANLKAGETLTVDQLLHVLLLPSANDAANVLACHISGSVENFSELMNAKAQELGATNTHFENPSGIHNDNHCTTARDMSIIGRYAYTFETIRNICQETEYALPSLPDGTERKFKTTNPLLIQDNDYYCEYATGLKTGYTNKAKSCIVATEEKNGMKLLCVVFGGDRIDSKHTYRDLDCKTLFEYGFNNYTDTFVCQKNSKLDLSNITDIPDILKESSLLFSDDIHMLVNNSSDLTPKIEWKNDLTLPIEKNSVVGTATYTINGNIYTVDLLSMNDIYPNNTENYMEYVFFGLIAFFILCFVFTFISSKHKNRFHTKTRYN